MTASDDKECISLKDVLNDSGHSLDSSGHSLNNSEGRCCEFRKRRRGLSLVGANSNKMVDAGSSNQVQFFKM